MKIKCPFWDDCFFDDAEDKFFIHLADHHYGEIKHELWRIWIKIHEKIEENDIADPEQMRVVDVLESLLENK